MGFLNASGPRTGVLAGLAAVLFLGGALMGCGLGRSPGGSEGQISDAMIAARVNGRPIYVEDVRARAVQRGLVQEGQDLQPDSDIFEFALEELIRDRLFADEAEARGLDRDPDVRRRLEAAREQVLATAVYDQIDTRANDPRAIERLYRENAGRLGQGQEVHLRHIQFQSREEAEAAKRRLDGGARFEALAFELSTDRRTAPEGGDLGWGEVADLAAPVRELVQRSGVGEVAAPMQINDSWHLFRIEDLRTRNAPSLEELRPRIIQWLRYRETIELQEKLEENASIERMRERDPSAPAAGAVTDPAAAPPADQPEAPAAATQPPAGAEAPAFPFPMGPGGVYGGEETTTAPPPAAQNQPPRPAPQRPPPPAPAPTPETAPAEGPAQ